ncbi:MAG TPA: DNA alkylation repair protein [Terriglobales bacterium]|nr:DNA alkylation repair protein [Terriglobales bacterium]
MVERKPTPAKVASEIRNLLKEGGSAEHVKGMQWFFKEEVESHGWHTAQLRREAVRLRAIILKDFDVRFLVQIADQLFSGGILEEKIFAVFLLEKRTHQLGNPEFRLFESWLDRIISWTDHDALVHYLVAPMIVAEPSRAKAAFRWAKSPNHWHRRAACVALIMGTRQKCFSLRLSAYPTSFWPMKMPWCKRGLAGYYEKQPKRMQSRSFPI